MLEERDPEFNGKLQLEIMTTVSSGNMQVVAEATGLTTGSHFREECGIR